MKKLILASAVITAFAGSLAHAEDAPPPPDNVVAYNVGLVSDYRYRGISQSRLEPALQGGADYTNNPTGFYAGTWLSTIKWITDTPGGSGNVEWDLYGGKRGDIGAGFSYDVGVLSYVYAGNGLPTSANTTEIYGQVGYGPAYIKLSDSVTNLFGFADSSGSTYIDVGANIDIATGLQLNLHAGRQEIKGTGNDPFSYSDWKIGVTKDFGFMSGSLAVIGTNSDVYVSPDAKNLGKTSLVVSVLKTF